MRKDVFLLTNKVQRKANMFSYLNIISLLLQKINIEILNFWIIKGLVPFSKIIKENAPPSPPPGVFFWYFPFFSSQRREEGTMHYASLQIICTYMNMLAIP